MNTHTAASPNTPSLRPSRLRWAIAVVALSGACSNEAAPPHDDAGAAREHLREQLTPTVRDELRDELRPVVIAELRRELAPTSPPPEPEPKPHPEPPPTPDPKPIPEPTPPPEPARPSADELWTRPGTTIWPSPGGLRLLELTVGTALEDKLPVGIASRYPEVPEILYCYTVFENPLPDQTITHVWRRSGRLVSRVELEVGRSPKWRTWSKQRTTRHWRGVWSCEVLSQDNTQLGLHVFLVGE